MRMRLRALVAVALVAVWGFALGSLALGQATTATNPDCVEDVMDLPALDVCRDAQGRAIMDLPAIGKLHEPAPVATAKPVTHRGTLPKTGAHVEDLAAIGLAALAGGAVLVRRLRLAVA
jgi:LPXTG-motif cell wall-anchored protein